MDTPATIEENAEALIRRFDADELPREFVIQAAKGLLPLPSDELIEVLLHLATGRDEEICILAKGALEDFPVDVILGYARDAESPEQLEQMARVVKDRAILEEVVRNRATRDETIVGLAADVKGVLQEVIVINQARVIRCPEILDALMSNPNLLPDVRRRVLETREEFFAKKEAREKLAAARKAEREAAEREESTAARDRALAEEAGAQLDAREEALLAELLAKVDENDEPAEATLGAPPKTADSKEKSVWVRVLTMSVSERVQAAFKAGRTERSILIRDRNRLVCSAVIRSPRLSESEVEMFAGMRNIEGEVLRSIGANREWMGKYPIMLALVRNPKAPIGVVLPLVPRLNARDLRSLSIDKGVPEAVRTTARRLFLTRTQGGRR